MEIGQLFELKIKDKFSYFQLVAIDNELGELIRVFPGQYNESIIDEKSIIKQKHSYYVYLFLKQALKQKNVLPKEVHKLPWRVSTPKYMRDRHLVKGEFISWQIIDTSTWKIINVKNLSKKQLKLSPWGIWNFDLLSSRIEENWSLINWK